MTDTASTALVVSLRKYHGLKLWWIGRRTGRNFVPYADIFAPTGYGFKDKVEAETMAMAIEERLKTRG
jgi:hypothetical protein